MAAIPPPSSLVGSGGPDEDSPFDGEKEREEINAPHIYISNTEKVPDPKPRHLGEKLLHSATKG